jgi:transposase
MKNERRKFSPEFKAKVAIEALREQMTLPELCKKYDVQPVQINEWKKQFQSNASVVFDKKEKQNDQESLIEKLYATIGELQVANTFLKKKLL